ncbi:MAG: thioredoxin [Flavobacteriales bacterium]|mgnify:CR=1 FL=1|nr:thioredoxin [Flavobacteriales bacterium]|tara:strand:+ start:573 stop:1607 length:1035 start_codon:yes stop_codon:yes gene_type:complete
MKNLIYYISPIFAISAIIFLSEPNKPKIKTYIHGVITNPKSDSIKIYNDELNYGARINYKNEFKLALEIDSADYFTFYDGNETTVIYLKPGECISLTLDTQEFDETITYINSEESNFLAKKYLIEENYFDLDIDSIYALNDSLYFNFFKILKEKLITELHNLSNNDFIDKETYNINQIMVDAGEWKKNWEKRQLALSVLPQPGESAIDFTYPDINKNNVSLSDFKGKYVYVDIWATWCGPCIYEIPHLIELEKKYHDKNIVFMSVSVDNYTNLEKWEEMIKEKGMGGEQLFASGWNSQIGNDYAISATGIPRFLLIDKDGNILDVNAPRPSSDRIKEILNNILY